MKRIFTFIITMTVLCGFISAQQLENLPLTAVEDVVPSHYTDTYNKMGYCLNDPFDYNPNNYFTLTTETPAPLVQTQVGDTTAFVALSSETNIGNYYGADSATFWDDNPLANNAIFEFDISSGHMLRYLDVWGRLNPNLDRRNKSFIVELYNAFGNSISTNTFELSSASADYPVFARVDLSSMGLDASMLQLATGIRIRHKVRHNGSLTDDSDFLHIIEARVCTSALMEEISIVGATGGTQNYANFNDLTKYLYNDAFVYNPLDPLSDTPDLVWQHPTDSGGYTPGLDTALFAVKKGLEDSWLEIFVDLKDGQSLSCIDLWTDERDNQPSYRYKNLVITLKDSVNGTSWSSPSWSGISHPSHHGRYTFPADVPDDLLFNATSIHIYNEKGNEELLVIFEARLAGFTRKNTKPIADAGMDQFVNWGDTVTLDASGTTDVDWYQTMSYTWMAQGISLSDPQSVNPTFVAPLVLDTTTYQIMLRVTDGEVYATPVYTRITVYPPENIKPIALAGNDTLIVTGETITLDASNSYDPDDFLSMYYLWTSLSGQITIDDPKVVSFNFTAPSVNDTTVFQFVLTVNDSLANSVPDTVAVTVIPGETSIKQTLVSDIVVYPNPFADIINIDLRTVNEPSFMKMYSLQGVLVYETQLSEGVVNFINLGQANVSGATLMVVESRNHKSVFKLQCVD